MSITNSTIVTSAGLDFITSAHNSGPLIAIKYFIPVWDYRIDPNIHNGTDTDVIDLSAAASASDTTPYGEKIWNINTSKAYSLSTTDNFVLSAGGETLNDSGDPWILTDSVMSKEQQINLYEGTSLSDYLSGTDVNASATSNAWEITDGARVVGDNSVPSETSANNDRYFEVVDYYPVSDGNILKGSFKCKLNKKIGTVKFNKVALYITQVDAQGNDTSNPTLFAEAMLSNPIVKTNYGTDGFDDIVIDVQIQIGSISTNFSDVFFATSADYWQRTIGGVYYPERVGVGTFDDGTEQPKAKVHIKSTSSTPNLRLDWGTGTSALTSATIYQTSGGDVELNLNSSTAAIRPDTTNNFYLGTNTYRFARLYSERVYTNLLQGDDYISLSAALRPLTTYTYDLGSSLKRFSTGYFRDIQSVSATLDYVEPTVNNAGPVGYSRLGSSLAPYKYLFIDSIYNPAADENLKLLSSLDPAIDNFINLGNASKRYSLGYINKLYLSSRTGHVVGEWTSLGNHVWNGTGSSWTTLPSDFKTRTGGLAAILNSSKWDYIYITDFKFTMIAKTLIIKFLLRFKVDENATFGSAEDAQLCVITPDNTTNGSPLNDIVRDGKDTSSGSTIYHDNYRAFLAMERTVGSDSAIILLVKYLNEEYHFCVRNEGLDNNSWAGNEYKFFVTLTYEIS